MNEETVRQLKISELEAYPNHPFRLYEGQQLEDMVASIRENGVLAPLIVRPLEQGRYQILSGHNRAEAARMAGLSNLPAIVKDNLDDNEAALIVTETNLIQRSFANMTHCERIIVLSNHYSYRY